MSEHPKTNISAKEYLTFEATSEIRHEYFDGEIFAMTGASFHHNIIAANVLSGLHHALANRDCFVFSSDMKVQVDAARHYTYPDISVVCGDVQFVGNRDDTVTNPLIIVEILSASTRDYDRGSKFTAYRDILSLRDYILIDQYSCHIEYFYKANAEKWSLEEYKELSDQLVIHSVGVNLRLSSIYHRVKW